MENYINGTYGSIKAFKGLFSNKDRFGKPLVTGASEQQVSMLGVPVPGGKYAPLVKYITEQTLPSIGNLNRFNPFEVFGLKEQTDARGNVTRNAKASWLGAVRTDNDGTKDDLGGVSAVSAARALGLTFERVDTTKNMQFTEDNFKRAVGDIKKAVGRLEKAREEEPDKNGQRYKMLSDAIITQKALAADIELGRVKAQGWLDSRGVPTRSGQRKFEELKKKTKAYLDATFTLRQELTK
jgi:hypothetical protein